MRISPPLFRGTFLALLAAGITALAAPAHAQLVTNGGFENDTSGDGNYFAGWTLSGAADYYSASPNTFVFGNPHSGDYAAWLGPAGSDGFLSQTVATTAGQVYTISYWLAVDSQDSISGLTIPNDFSAAFDGHPLIIGTNLAATDSHPDAADDYTLYSFTAVAHSAASTLQFGFRNDNSEFRLDDVSITPAAVPEASTTISLGLLLLALGSLSVIARRKNASKKA